MHATTFLLAALSLATTSLAASSPAAVEKRFEGGWCGVHVQVTQDHDNHWATVKVFDSNQVQIAQKDAQENVGDAITAAVGGNGLTEVLVVKVVAGTESPVNSNSSFYLRSLAVFTSYYVSSMLTKHVLHTGFLRIRRRSLGIGQDSHAE
ncbi:hypothetical protein PG993_013169 [Apiospora rasikravindrae]|uniref:Uncharacterized protein n=1 Tax=Apiospora rasikravindrae TaxID=990691 RepID=A0ABR1RY22_9PEZI